MKLPVLRDDGVAGGSSMMPKSQRERLRTAPTIGDSSIEDDRQLEGIEDEAAHPQRRWCRWGQRYVDKFTARRRNAEIVSRAYQLGQLVEISVVVR